jgi:hypothetical protein
MDIDERRCPACGHAVLDWETTCPGCDQVPSLTRKGQQALRRRRRRMALLTAGPIAGALVIVALFLLVTNWSLWRWSAAEGQQSRLWALLKQGEPYLQRLDAATPGSAEEKQALEVLPPWLEIAVPALLDTARNADQAQAVRLEAVEWLGRLLHLDREWADVDDPQADALRAATRRHSAQIVETLTALKAEHHAWLRRAARLALGSQ